MTADKRQHRCKECAKHYTQRATADWRKNNPSSVKESTQRTKIRQAYGLELEDVYELLNQQNSQCKICKVQLSFDSTEKHVTPHIDHDHQTGQIRGLLCSTCNTGLGMFGDSPELLIEASAYLVKSVMQRERLSEETFNNKGCDSPTTQESNCVKLAEMTNSVH